MVGLGIVDERVNHPADAGQQAQERTGKLQPRESGGQSGRRFVYAIF